MYLQNACGIGKEEKMGHLISLLIGLVIGAISGTIAGYIMKSKNVWWVNIILGVVGGMVASFLFGLVNIGLTGPFPIIGKIIFGVVGACLLIFVARLIKK